MLLDADVLLECNKMKDNSIEFHRISSGSFLICGKFLDNQKLIKSLKDIIKEIKEVN